MKTKFLFAAATAAFGALLARPAAAADQPPRLNVLFITVDDMNFDTPGSFGGPVADLTPNIDKLASQGRRFLRAHVAVAVCQPSRECLMTGDYAQTNGATGFYPVKPEVVTLQEQLKAHGYLLGILGKVGDLKPAEKFPWDYKHGQQDLGAGRDPQRYFAFAKEFFAQAKSAAKPFFLMANSHDPHRPYVGSSDERPLLSRQVYREISGISEGAGGGRGQPDVPLIEMDFPRPSRIFRAGEVPVPGFLPDLPDVRTEIAQYYSSCRRADQTVGQILQALDESGLADSTLVIFLSDNGISMPFAKSNCYLTSSHTPCIVRWPGKVAAGSTDEANFVSGVDFMPTILEAVGVPAPAKMDGRTFLPLLTGGTQADRDHVFTSYNDTSVRDSFPMRCVQTARFGYIFNGWSDGTKEYRAESMTGITFNAMSAAAATNPAVAQRVEFFLHRVPEELYDLQKDPNALHNLIGDPKYETEVRELRNRLAEWMKRVNDPLLSGFIAKTRPKP